MNIKKYIKNRKYEMLKISSDLGKKREILIQQGQQLQVMLTQTNKQIEELEIELKVLDGIEKKLEEDKNAG